MNDFNINWTELLWEGETISGEFIRGQLFRFQEHYYICNNIPVEYKECIENGWYPPTIGWWHKMKPDTLRECKWKYVD